MSQTLSSRFVNAVLSGCHAGVSLNALGAQKSTVAVGRDDTSVVLNITQYAVCAITHPRSYKPGVAGSKPAPPTTRICHILVNRHLTTDPLAVGTSALAKNCGITGSPNSLYILVGINFKVPGKEKCSPFNSFNPVAANWPAVSNACTSSDGTNLSFTLTISAVSPHFAEIDAMSLSLPEQTGEVAGPDDHR
jgi:hypothetical protein